MGKLTHPGPVFTILDGATKSNVVVRLEVSVYEWLSIFAPAHGTTVTLQAAHVEKDDDAYVDADFFNVESDLGSDLQLSDSKATVFKVPPAGAFRLLAAVAVTGDQVFNTFGERKAGE